MSFTEVQYIHNLEIQKTNSQGCLFDKHQTEFTYCKKPNRSVWIRDDNTVDEG